MEEELFPYTMKHELDGLAIKFTYEFSQDTIKAILNNSIATAILEILHSQNWIEFRGSTYDHIAKSCLDCEPTECDIIHIIHHLLGNFCTMGLVEDVEDAWHATYQVTDIGAKFISMLMFAGKHDEDLEDN